MEVGKIEKAKDNYTSKAKSTMETRYVQMLLNRALVSFWYDKVCSDRSIDRSIDRQADRST